MSNDNLVGQFDFQLTQDVLNSVRATGLPYETEITEDGTGRALSGSIFLDKSDAGDVVRLKVSVFSNQDVVAQNGDSAESRQAQTDHSGEINPDSTGRPTEDQIMQTEAGTSLEQVSQTLHSGEIPIPPPPEQPQESRLAQTEHSGEISPPHVYPTEDQTMQTEAGPSFEQVAQTEHTGEIPAPPPPEQPVETRPAQTEHSGVIPDTFRPTEHQTMQTDVSDIFEQVSQTEHTGELPELPPPVEAQENSMQTVDLPTDEISTQTDQANAAAQSSQTDVPNLDSSAIQTEFIGTDQISQTEEKEEFEQVTQTEPPQQDDQYSQTVVKTYEDYFSQTNIVVMQESEFQTDVNETFEIEAQTDELECFEQEVQTFVPVLKERHMQTDIKEFEEQEAQTIIKVYSEVDMQTDNAPLVEGEMQTDVAELEESGFQTEELETFECDVQTDPTPLSDQVMQTEPTPVLEQECQTQIPVKDTKVQTDDPQLKAKPTQTELECEDQLSQTENAELVELEVQTDPTPVLESSMQTEVEPGQDQDCQTEEVRVYAVNSQEEGVTQTDLVWVQNLQITTGLGPAVELGFVSPVRESDAGQEITPGEQMEQAENAPQDAQQTEETEKLQGTSEGGNMTQPGEQGEGQYPGDGTQEVQSQVPTGAVVDGQEVAQVMEPPVGLPPLEPAEIPVSGPPELQSEHEQPTEGVSRIVPVPDHEGEYRVIEEKFVQTDPVTIIIGDASFLVQKLQQGEEIAPRRGQGTSRRGRRRKTQEAMMIKKEGQTKKEEGGDEPPTLSPPENITEPGENKEMPILAAVNDQQDQKPYVPRKYGRTALPLRPEKPNYSPLKFRYPTMRSDDGLKPSVVVGQFNCPYCADNFNDSATLYQHLHANHDAPRATNKRKRRSRNVIIIDNLDDENGVPIQEHVVGYVEGQEDPDIDIEAQKRPPPEGSAIQTIELVTENGTEDGEGNEEGDVQVDGGGSGKRAFSCPFCPKMFGKSSALYVHLQSSHRSGTKNIRRPPERSRLKIVGGDVEVHEGEGAMEMLAYHEKIKREQQEDEEDDEYDDDEGQQIQLEFVAGEEETTQEEVIPQEDISQEEPPPEVLQEEVPQEEIPPEQMPVEEQVVEAETEPVQPVEEAAPVEEDEEEEVLDQGEPFPEDDEDDDESTSAPSKEKAIPDEEEDEEEEEELKPPEDDDAPPLRGSRRRSMAVGDKIATRGGVAEKAEKGEKKGDQASRRTRSSSTSASPPTRSPTSRTPSKRRREAMEESPQESRKVYATRGSTPAKRGKRGR